MAGNHQAWDHMTQEQKSAFLNELAENLASDNRSLQVEIYSLLGKILSIESKLSDLDQQLNQAFMD